MTRRSFPGSVLDGALTLARMPADLLLSFADRGRAAAAVRGLVDGTDAAARAVAGMMVGDQQLRRDASRRRGAAEERLWETAGRGRL